MTSKLRPHLAPINNIVYNFANYIRVIYISIKTSIIPTFPNSIDGLNNDNLHDESFPVFTFGVSFYPLNFLHPVLWAVLDLHPMEDTIPNLKCVPALKKKVIYIFISIIT